MSCYLVGPHLAQVSVLLPGWTNQGPHLAQVSEHSLSCLFAGLSAPVPRGRKGKKLKNQLCLPELKNADWLVNCNPEVVLQDDSYKKHLKQHCNKCVCPTPVLLPQCTWLRVPQGLTIAV